MPEEESAVNGGYVSERHPTVLGQGFDRMFPVEPATAFAPLLRAIDEADRRAAAAAGHAPR